MTSISTALFAAVSFVLFVPHSDAAPLKTTGIQRTFYRCTKPIALSNPGLNFRNGQFEDSLSWQSFRRDFAPAEFKLQVSVGRALELHLGARFEAHAEGHPPWRVDLESHSYHPTTASLLETAVAGDAKKRLSKSEKALVRMSFAFHLFSPKKWKRAVLANSVSAAEWQSFFAQDFTVYASSAKDYAVLLTDSLEAISICLPLPQTETDLRKHHEDVAPNLKAREVRNAAFRFLSKFNELFVGACEKPLKPKH